MIEERFVITDRQWSKIEPHCLGKKTDPGRTGGDGRLFLEAVLWIARTGSPWRDLPLALGNWNSVFKRFRDWVKADVFKRIFDAVSEEPDMEFAMIDGTIVKVHRHGQGAKGRFDDQNRGLDRCLGLPGALCSAARTTIRYRRRCPAHRRH